MKKITTLLLSLMSTALMAQIPNASFENWTSGSPNNWTILTFYASGSVTQSSTAQAGSSSVSLNSVSVSGNYYGGFVQTGPSLTDDYFANSGNPTAVNGWYQMTTSGGDYFTGAVTAKNGSNPMGAGTTQISTASSVWKQFSICVTYSTGTADSLSIQLEIANNGGQTHAGSFVLIDDLTFGTCITGINELSNDVALEPSYPNPASTLCNVIFSIPDEGNVSVDLYDISGRKVMDCLENTQLTPGRYKIPVNVSSLASGIYIYRVSVNGTTYSQKLTVAR